MRNKIRRVMHWFYRLNLKKIVAINVFLLIIAVVPISLKVALNPTRTRSEAALLPKPQPISNEFVTPTGPPKIFLVDHFFGKEGDAVLIHGENLGGLHENSWVALGGKKVAEENLVSWTADYIEFKVPTGARSGPVEISILGKRALWEGTFFVINDEVETELRLQGEGMTANLMGSSLAGGKELLVWLLVIAGEGELQLTPVSGVSMRAEKISLPVGEIYEVRLGLSEATAQDSILRLVPLLKVTKQEEQLIGIARGELSTGDRSLIPLYVHPLYVSF